MDIAVNYLAIIVAAIAAMALGFIWYHPKVFGGAWMRMAGVNPEGTPKQKMMVHMVLGLLVAGVSAYVLAHFVVVWAALTWVDALQLGFWVWLGFQVPILAGAVLWDKKPWALFYINAGYQLITMVVMALILVLWV